MTCETTEVSVLIIGDDYKANQSRAVTLDFCAITGFSTSSATGKMGFKNVTGDVTTTALITGGVVTDNGNGTWKVTFDIDQTDTASLVEGSYDWSVEIADGTEEVTVGRNEAHSDRIDWVAKHT